MSAASHIKHPPKLRGDLAGMAQALAEFAQQEFPQSRSGTAADRGSGAVLQ